MEMNLLDFSRALKINVDQLSFVNYMMLSATTGDKKECNYFFNVQK